MDKILPRVLLVDDSQDQLDLLFNALSSKYKLVAATNGKKAITLARKEPQPDLILLDIIMPGMDGYETCEVLKSGQKTGHIPVILLTGKGDEVSEKIGLSSGAIDFIRKPFNIGLLCIRIDNLLKFKKYQDELQQTVADRTKELKITQALLIESLGILAEFRDPETGGHIKRTQNYVKALAKELQKNDAYKEQLSSENIELLHQSAPLHDIGKVAIPDNILLKPDKLTKEEFDEMKNHSLYGYNMLRKTMRKLPDKSFIKNCMDIAISHHEKWDGNGYPNGWKGKQIPLSGRLMSLADVYDALISKRCYKKPLLHEDAVKIIIQGKGTHFDPDIVDAFVHLENTFRNIALTYADTEKVNSPAESGIQKKYKILLVDDNEINLEIMKNQIEYLGNYVTIAKNGLEALNKLESCDFDLIMSDLDMPTVDGYQLMRKIQVLSLDIPVIAITASDYDLTPKRLHDIGFSGYLLKPFDDEELKKIFKTTL